jgi:hypothetical protein
MTAEEWARLQQYAVDNPSGTAAAAVAQIDALAAEVVRLREALAFYADAGNYAMKILRDGGAHGRAALASPGSAQGGS